jgi:hypothetical protein
MGANPRVLLPRPSGTVAASLLLVAERRTLIAGIFDADQSDAMLPGKSSASPMPKPHYNDPSLHLLESTGKTTVNSTTRIMLNQGGLDA